MFIYLNHTDLVGKGFLSFFISKQFNLEIHGKETTILSLSSVYKHIGLVREVLDSQFTLRLYEKDVLLEEIIVKLTDIPFLDEEIETKSVKINNSLCRGSFYIYKFRYDGFTDLENLFLKKKTTFLTKSCDNRRITYYSEFYSTDSLFRFGNKRQAKEFPFGWERRIINNQLVYLDHNTKTTSFYIFNRNILPNMAIKSIFKIKLEANRKNTLLSVRNALLEKEYSLSDSELSVKFQDEIGDGVGVLRDFFSLLGLELKKDVRLECINGFIDLNHNYKFKSNEDCDFLRVLGIILGISLANKCTLNLKFSLNFLESISNLQFSICKIQDTAIQKSFLQIKRKEISLEEAKEIFCLDENVPTDLDTFINYLLRNTFYTPREEAYKVIQKSLSPFLRNEVNSYELFYLLYIPELSCDDLFRVINLQNCSPTTKEIIFLKEILKDDHLRMKFIIFATGESSVPEDDVIILEQCDVFNYYFSATTCNKNVKMGMYNSKIDMERILIASIRNMEFRIV